MADPGWLCQTCEKAQAVSFCTCTGSATLFCEVCFYGHYQKQMNKQHPTFPISALRFRDEDKYFEHLHTRMLQFPRVREQANSCLRVLAQCKSEVSAATEALLSTLSQHCRDILSLLDKRKSEIEAALNAVETSLVEERPDFSIPFAQELRDFTDQEVTDFVLFTYQLNHISPESLLLVNLEDQPYALNGLKQYPCLYRGSLSLQDLGTNTKQECTLPQSFTKGTMFCLRSRDVVFCLGGYPATSNAYSYAISRKEFSKLHNMGTARAYPGVALVGSDVFAFGSYNPLSREAEMYTSEWKALQSMSTPRCCFSPGVHIKDIYLASPYASSNRAIEVYSTVCHTYRMLAFQLPETLEGYVSAFLLNGELVVLAGTQVGRWRVGEETDMQVTVLKEGSAPLSNCPVYVAGKDALLVDYYSGQLYRFSTETASIVEFNA